MIVRGVSSLSIETQTRCMKTGEVEGAEGGGGQEEDHPGLRNGGLPVLFRLQRDGQRYQGRMNCYLSIYLFIY